MEPIEYFTVPELPGKPMFHCTRRSASLQVASCAALWTQTNNNKSPECSQLCKSCPIGAHHAGEGDIAQSSLCGIPICSRCQRTGLRLIGHDICVSCWNRERECVIGKNARGRKPLNHPPLVPHAVTVMTGGNVVTVRKQRAVSVDELIIGALRDNTRQVYFGLRVVRPDGYGVVPVQGELF